VYHFELHIQSAAALSFLPLPEAALSHVAQSGSTTRLNSSEPFGLSMNMNAPSVENRALPQTINNNFAAGNYGFQAGTITGHVNAEFHHHAPGTVRLGYAQRLMLFAVT
jgi:hypothetical protein